MFKSQYKHAAARLIIFTEGSYIRWTLTLLVDSEKLQNFASISRLVSFSLWGEQRARKGHRNVIAIIFGNKSSVYIHIRTCQQQICNVDNICDAHVTCTDHGIAQYVGGLAQFVLRDSTVEEYGLQQAGVVQVNVIVPFLWSQITCKHTFNPVGCNYSQKQANYCTKSFSVNNDCCVRLPSHSV